MLRNILPFLLVSTACTSLAQVPAVGKIRHQAVVGYNIGAVSPIGLPATIRKIYGYSPLFAPSFGYEGLYKVKNHWMLGYGLRVDFKAMRVRDSVAYMPTIIHSGKDRLEGVFSGRNQTSVRNIYLTLPVYLQWTPAEKWHYKLGMYMAYLLRPKFEGKVSDGYIRNGGSLGEKVAIASAEFDFSARENRWDIGIHAGIAHDIAPKWAVAAQVQWGLLPVFPSSFNGVSFKMYNIFGNIGVAYSL